MLEACLSSTVRAPSAHLRGRALNLGWAATCSASSSSVDFNLEGLLRASVAKLGACTRARVMAGAGVPRMRVWLLPPAARLGTCALAKTNSTDSFCLSMARSFCGQYCSAP